MDWLKRHGATAEVCYAGSGDSGDIVSTEILVDGKQLDLDRLSHDDSRQTFSPEPEDIFDAITALADSVLEDYPDEASVFNNEGGEVDVCINPFDESPDVAGPGIIELRVRFLTWHDGGTVRA